MTTIIPNAWKERIDVKLPEEGAYPARLFSIVHQGTTVWKFGPSTQAIFRFELPTEKAVFVEGWEELPHCVNVYVSVSYSKRWAFLQVLDKLWVDTSKPFELEKVLGSTCQISVMHKQSGDKTYLNAKWKDIAKLMKGTKVDKQVNDSRLFWFTADYDMEEGVDDKGEKTFTKTGCSNVTMEGYDNLNQWEQEKVESSWEYQSLIASASPATEEMGDVDEDDRF